MGWVNDPTLGIRYTLVFHLLLAYFVLLLCECHWNPFKKIIINHFLDFNIWISSSTRKVLLDGENIKILELEWLISQIGLVT